MNILQTIQFWKKEDMGGQGILEDVLSPIIVNKKIIPLTSKKKKNILSKMYIYILYIFSYFTNYMCMNRY